MSGYMGALYYRLFEDAQKGGVPIIYTRKELMTYLKTHKNKVVVFAEGYE